MKKSYNVNVELQSGTAFLLKVNGENLDEITAWLESQESVAAHEIIGSIVPRTPRSKHENGIAAARTEKGWTQQELADAIGVAQQHIQRWEAGVYKPKAETLRRIGEALGVEWTSLLND